MPFPLPDLFPEVEAEAEREIQVDAKFHGQALQVVDTRPERDGLLRLFQKLHRGSRTPNVGHSFLEDRVTVAVGGLEGEGEIGDMEALPRRQAPRKTVLLVRPVHGVASWIGDKKMIAHVVPHRAWLAIQIVGDGDRAKDFQGLGGRLGPFEDETDDSAKIHSMRLTLLFSERAQIIGYAGGADEDTVLVDPFERTVLPPLVHEVHGVGHLSVDPFWRNKMHVPTRLSPGMVTGSHHPFGGVFYEYGAHDILC